MLNSIILNNDEYVSTKAETDYNSLEVSFTAKSDSSTLHITECDMMNGKNSGFGITYIFDCLVENN